MNKKCVGEHAACKKKKKKNKKKTSGIVTRKPEQEAHTWITSDQYESTMCAKCHVTARVSRDRTLGVCGPFKAERREDCRVFDDGQSHKNKNREQTRSRGNKHSHV